MTLFLSGKEIYSIQMNIISGGDKMKGFLIQFLLKFVKYKREGFSFIIILFRFPYIYFFKKIKITQL